MPPLRVGTFLAPRFRDLYREAVAGSLGEEATLVEDATFDDLLEGRLHAAFLCGLPYVWLRERAGAALAPLVAPVITGERYGGRPRYFSDLVVRAGDGAGGLEDLAGRRIAFNERASQSGFGVLVSALERRGLGPGHFGATIETGAHVASLEAVRRGDADAAAGLSRTGAGSPRHLVDCWVPVDDSDYDPTRRTAAEVRERGGL